MQYRVGRCEDLAGHIWLDMAPRGPQAPALISRDLRAVSGVYGSVWRDLGGPGEFRTVGGWATPLGGR